MASTRYGINRRTLVKGGAAAIAAPALLGPGAARGQGRVIKIGHVSPRTGPLAGFGEADNFIIDQVRAILKKGIQIGGRDYQVQIVSKDSQSTGSRAAEVASELRPRSTRSPASAPIVRGSRISSAAKATRRRASPGPTCSSGASKT